MRRRDELGRLVEIACDAHKCRAILEPGPHVVTSGWLIYGQIIDVRRAGSQYINVKIEVDVCPKHNDEGPHLLRNRVEAAERRSA